MDKTKIMKILVALLVGVVALTTLLIINKEILKSEEPLLKNGSVEELKLETSGLKGQGIKTVQNRQVATDPNSRFNVKMQTLQLVIPGSYNTTIPKAICGSSYKYEAKLILKISGVADNPETIKDINLLPSSKYYDSLGVDCINGSITFTINNLYLSSLSPEMVNLSLLMDPFGDFRFNDIRMIIKVSDSLNNVFLSDVDFMDASLLSSYLSSVSTLTDNETPPHDVPNLYLNKIDLSVKTGNPDNTLIFLKPMGS